MYTSIQSSSSPMRAGMHDAVSHLRDLLLFVSVAVAVVVVVVVVVC